jgi:hypothetical protein
MDGGVPAWLIEPKGEPVDKASYVYIGSVSQYPSSLDITRRSILSPSRPPQDETLQSRIKCLDQGLGENLSHFHSAIQGL